MTFAVLGIDTSGSSCSAALVRGNSHDKHMVASRRREVGNAHAAHVLPMVRDVLADAATSLSACDAIAYTVGPGSFTGLRIASAVAQGLAFGAHLRIAEIDTLAAMARQVPARSRTSLLVAQDARMDEVYWALYDREDDEWRSRIDATLTPARQLASVVTGRSSLPIDAGTGSAWSVHATLLDGLVSNVVTSDGVDAVDVAMLGLDACEAGRLVEPDATALRYVRDRVALTTREREAAKARAAEAAA